MLQIHVVDETRLYPIWGEGEKETSGEELRVGPSTGIVAAKRALNDLHKELALSGYSEVYVDQMDGDVVAVTRHEPRSRRSVVLVAFTAFADPDLSKGGRHVRPLRFEGQLDEVAFEATMRRLDSAAAPFARHPRLVNGLDGYECRVRRGVPVAQSAVFASARVEGSHTVLEFRPLEAGTVVAVRVSPQPAHAAALAQLHRSLEGAHVDEADPLALMPAFADLDLTDFNALLYRCDAEEREAGGGGVYDVPGRGALPYAGLQGVASLLAEVTPDDDLGHPLCANLRDGDWLPEYVWRRLEREPRLTAVGARLRDALRPVAALPRFLVPAYFAAVALAAYRCARRAALARMGAWARSDSFVRSLALTGVQLTACVPSAPLPPLSPALPPPRPLRPSSLSAGLPHFAVGYMRCWGRDTFISLRGLFILTGRYQVQKKHSNAYNVT